MLATLFTAFAAGGARMASAEECTGPFRQCAIDVGAVCSRDPDGQQRMTYYDRGGNVQRFEKCAGGIYEASGRPNPYKTGVAPSADFPPPLTELLYPHVDM